MSARPALEAVIAMTENIYIFSLFDLTKLYLPTFRPQNRRGLQKHLSFRDFV